LSSFFNLFKILIPKNNIKPKITKDITLFINNQYFIAGAQALLRESIDSYFFQSKEIYNAEKSTFHINKPIGGIITLSTSDFITVAKAQPNINQTAKSTAFHFIKKSLKSFSIIKES